MRYIRESVFGSIIILVLFACNTGAKPVQPTDSSMYDLAHPVIMKLPDGLAEISGITYYPKDTSVFAIEDEAGVLYKISLNRKEDIQKWKFDKKHDFEDVVLHDSIFYVLISNGDIESIQFDKNDSIITHTSSFPNAGKKTNEFESIYYDDSLKQMVLLCKDCEDDNKKTISAWGYNIASGAYTPSIFTIDVQPIAQKLGEEKIKLKPSAMAIDPATNEFYILCSINRLLIVTDRQGKFKELYALDPAIYKQPEGIAFTPKGDMMISNEAHETGLADILLIKNKKKGL